MNIIHHQLQKKPFYIPQWNIKYLFLGTFNPSGGESVEYYYGRPKNQTWKLLSKIFHDDLNPNAPTFFDKIKKHGIGCMDMIHSVRLEHNNIDNIIGKGYNDNKIINNTTRREYNTTSILQVIKKNSPCIFSTWGKGVNLQEWQNEIAKLKGITPLVSPSLAARVPAGSNKFEYMLSDWRIKISRHCNDI